MLPYKVALTGGIGSGKSYIADIFRHINIPVFESDTEAKRLYNDIETIEFVRRNIQENVINDAGAVDFAQLAKVVFNDKAKLETLNAYIHPKVMEKYVEWSDGQKSPYTINESAIVFESNLQSHFDCIITVIANVDTRIERVVRRSSTTNRADVVERINNQYDDHYRLKHSNFVIENNDNQLLVPQVIEINGKIIRNFCSK